MRITTATAIKSLIPNAEFVIRGGVIEWIVPSIAPVTEEEIAAELARLQAEQPLKIAEANRKAAYTNESDPLFFKAQRGEATEQEWLDKIAEIKARFPKE